jgi:thioredoxin-like negative regulator of GroEL
VTSLLAAAAVAAAAGIPWTSDIDAAFRAATERHVPVVVDVWAVWCVPCKRMDDETYVDPRVVEAAAWLVPLKVDADAQPIFVDRYAVQAFPEVLFLDEDGRELGRLTGFQDAAGLLPALERAAAGYASYRDWMRGKEDPETVLTVGEYFAALGNRGRAGKALVTVSKRIREEPATLSDASRLRLGKALVAVGEGKEGASVLFALSKDGSTRDVQRDALEALAELDSVRGAKELSRAAEERLAREFGK